jgi:TonB family protein
VLPRILAFAVLIGIANVGLAGAQTLPGASPTPSPLPSLTPPPCANPDTPPETLKHGSVDIPTKITETIGRERVKITVLLDDQGRVTDAHADADIADLVPLGVKIGRTTVFSPARHDCKPEASLVIFYANISGDGLQRPPRVVPPPAEPPCTVPNRYARMTNPYPATANGDAKAGTVKVEVQVDRTGELLGATVVDGPKNLQRAALEAVRLSTFAPETRACLPRQGVAIVDVAVGPHA